MSKELDELQKMMNSNDEDRLKFREYSQVFNRTNENLKYYIKDLKNKRILCVSSSGDHLLNSLYAGADEIDTFDINRFSALYQELTIYAIKYLRPIEAYSFLMVFLPNMYWKFNNKLPPHLKEFFDYLFTNYDYLTIHDKFLNCELYSDIANNNYATLERIPILKERLKSLVHKHYVCDIYTIISTIKEKYDVIYLSNILEYQKNFDIYFDTIRTLIANNLNEGGELYYNYIWGLSEDDNIRCCYRRKRNDYITYEEIQKYKDIIDSTERIVIPSVQSNHRNENGFLLPDTVLKIRK